MNNKRKFTKQELYEHKSIYGKWVRTYQKDWMILILGNHCELCGSIKNLEIDHIIPKFRNTRFPYRRDDWSNLRPELEINNLRVLCKKCNMGAIRGFFDEKYFETKYFDDIS
jgi:5-methylcytosine-specific restriction endonuclease McrA